MRSAFTLIELLIAMMLSMVILLVTFAVFRVGSSAMSVATRLTVENEQIRRGIVLALEQNDFWTDYADPEFPYGKAYNGMTTINNAGAEVAASSPQADNPNNKRIFRRVTFAETGSFNVNWTHVHDPRSWYRNHLAPNPRPVSPNSSISGHAFWANALHAAGGTWNLRSSDVPPGWEARHIWGDYSLTSNTAMDPAVDLRGARPRLMLDMYIQLGVDGVANYMPAGTIQLIQQPSTNLANRAANPTDWRYCYNVGEIPYQLAARNSHTAWNGSLYSEENLRPFWQPQVSGTSWASGGSVDRTGVVGPTTMPAGISAASLGINTDNWQRAHYYEGLQGRNVGRNMAWAEDFDSRMSSDVLLWGNVFLHSWSNSAGATVISPRLIHVAARHPWGVMQSRTNNWDLPPIQDAYLRDYGNVLSLSPQSYANDPEPNKQTRPPGLPMVSLTSLRYRFRSGEFNNSILRLVDPERGKTAQFGIFATGTTYRGARQHWALVTDNPGTAAFDPTQGDEYR